MRFLIGLVVAASLFTVSSSFAEHSLHPTNGPGGIINDFAFGPAGDILAAMQRGLWRSTDKGRSWRSVSDVLERRRFSSVAISDNGTILIGGSYGLARSTDKGASWENNFEGWDIEAIALGQGDTVYAIPEGRSCGCFFRSADDGATWEQSNQLPQSLLFKSLVVSADGTIYVLRYNKLQRSSDGGDSWNRVVGPNADSTMVMVAITSQGHIFAYPALNRRSSFLSTDFGITWTQFYPEGWNPNSIWAIDASPDGDIYLATNDSLMYSNDEGRTWKSSLRRHVKTIAVDKAGDPILWGHEGVFRSDDRGESWRKTGNGPVNIMVNDVAVGRHGDLWTATEWGAYLSTDKGQTWMHRDPDRLPVGLETVFITRAGSVIGARSFGSVKRSTDRGSTWQRVERSRDIEHEFVEMIQSADGPIYARMLFRGLATSSDDGASWTLIDSLRRTEVYAIAVSAEGTLYASTENGMLRSSDEGQTWSAAESGLPLEYKVHSLAADRSFVYAGTLGGAVYRVADFGSGWELAGRVFDDREKSVIDLSIAADGGIFAASDFGVSYSSDQGQGWISLPSDLENPKIESIAVDDEGTLFAGSWFRGVYRSNKIITSLKTEPRDPGTTAILEAIAPNPLQSNTRIRFQLSQAADLKLTIYAAPGTEIEVLLSDWRAAGSYSIDWSADGLPRGLYFCVLEVGNDVQSLPMLLR